MKEKKKGQPHPRSVLMHLGVLGGEVETAVIRSSRQSSRSPRPAAGIEQ
jgi:hypothetical protein